MAAISIERGAPFSRGDMSIEVSIDGKKAGMLLADKPFAAEVLPGEHIVQASMSGMRGKKLCVNVEAGTTLHVQVWGTKPPTGMNWIHLVAFIPPIVVSPIRAFWLWAILLLISTVLSFCLLRKQSLRMLRLLCV